MTVTSTLLRAPLFSLILTSMVEFAGAQQVFNVPPDVPPKDVVANTIVNLLPGADVLGLLNVEDGGVVNMSGGRIGNVLHVLSGSTVTMSGGNVNSALRAFDGSTLVVSGGTVGQIAFREGSNVTVKGYDFRIDGAIVPGLNTVGASLEIIVPFDSLFSGSLEDGTPFAYSGDGGGDDITESITLLRTTTPSLEPSFTISSVTELLGVGAGQTLTLTDGGMLPENFNAGRDSEVLIQGGFVGRNFEAVASRVTINAGEIDLDF